LREEDERERERGLLVAVLMLRVEDKQEGNPR
jgi:hypothetical protein